MSDLIARLRDRSGFVERGPMALMQHCEEAAAELERLTAENAALRAERDAASGAFAVLLNYAQDSDDSCYGTLGTQLVREIIAQTGFRIDSARAKESGNG